MKSKIVLTIVSFFLFGFSSFAEPVYSVVIRSATRIGNCMVYQITIWSDNDTPLDPADDHIVASTAIEDCPGDAVATSGVVNGTLEVNPCEIYFRVELYDEDMNFVVKGFAKDKRYNCE